LISKQKFVFAVFLVKKCPPFCKLSGGWMPFLRALANLLVTLNCKNNWIGNCIHVTCFHPADWLNSLFFCWRDVETYNQFQNYWDRCHKTFESQQTTHGWLGAQTACLVINVHSKFWGVKITLKLGKFYSLDCSKLIWSKKYSQTMGKIQFASSYCPPLKG
jgi:hypothetical protein